jgi:hypothetical protein
VDCTKNPIADSPSEQGSAKLEPNEIVVQPIDLAILIVAERISARGLQKFVPHESARVSKSRGYHAGAASSCPKDDNVSHVTVSGFCS